jgi:hypothetical protein
MMIDHAVKMGFFNAGTVHAIAEMSFGVAAYSLYERLRDKKFGAVWTAVLSLLEIYAIYRFLALTFYQPVALDNFRRIPYLIIIILLSFLNVTYFSRFMNRSFWRGLGHISLTMYLAHVHLAQVYIQGLVYIKTRLVKSMITSPAAGVLLSLLKNTIGEDENFRTIPMTWKDALLFTLLVVFVSLLILGAAALTRRFYRAARERLAAALASGDGEPPSPET